MKPNGRNTWIAANWKMNHTLKECDLYFESFLNLYSLLASNSSHFTSHLKTAFFPNTLALDHCQKKFSSETITIGSQNTHFAEKGAFTGEISTSMLKEIRVSLSLVGHSERRQYFGETDSTTKKRTTHLLKENFTVIHCIGETKEERLNGKTEEILKTQINEGFPDTNLLTENLCEKFIIAYEPVWAIGTGLTASLDQVAEAHTFIRDELKNRYGKEISEKISILYGGSVTPENFKDLYSLKDVDGGLVGGASLKPESFFKLIEIAAQSA